MDVYVEAVGAAGGEGAAESGADLVGTVDVLAVAAEGLHYQVIAGTAEVAGHRFVAAVDAQLELALYPPAAVIAYYDDHGEVVADGGVELGHIETQGAVAGHDYGRLVGMEDLSGESNGKAGAQGGQGT